MRKISFLIAAHNEDKITPELDSKFSTTRLLNSLEITDV
nr:hypothetical protein [uncultured archaeon]AQS28802.1 hypothetical protein [uncultured archaeon]